MEHNEFVSEKALVDYIEEYKSIDDQSTTPSLIVILIVGSIVAGSLFVDFTLSSHVTIFSIIALIIAFVTIVYYLYKILLKNLRLEKLASIIINNIDDAIKLWGSGYYLESDRLTLNPQIFHIASSDTEVKVVKHDNEYKYKISLYSYKYKIILEFTPSGSVFHLDIIRYDGKGFSMYMKNNEIHIFNEQGFIPENIEKELIEKIYNKLHENQNVKIKEIISSLRSILKELYTIQ